MKVLNDRGIPAHDCDTMSVVLVALVAIISFADLLAELVLSVTLDVLDRIGNDPHARFAFFKRFVEPAQEAVGDRALPGSSIGIPCPLDP